MPLKTNSNSKFYANFEFMAPQNLWQLKIYLKGFVPTQNLCQLKIMATQNLSTQYLCQLKTYGISEIAI